MTKSVGVHEAKTQLSRLLADVQAGDEVIITSRGQPIARLVSIEPSRRMFGMDRGRLVIPEDFDAPLEADLLDAFEA